MEGRNSLPLRHRSNKITWIPEDTYTLIKQYIPIPCVDVFIEDPEKGFLWIRRNIPPQLHEWAPVGGRIMKFESPDAACKRIVQKEIGLEIKVKEFIGFTEFRDENHFISLNFKATIKDPHQETHINKNEVSGYVFSYEMPRGTADQYIDIYQKLRRQQYEK